MTTVVNVPMDREQTAEYRPSPVNFPSWHDQRLPPFSIRYLETMLFDHQVRLVSLIKRAMLQHVKFTLNCKRPDVAKYITDTVSAFWASAGPELFAAMWYTMAGGEVIYRREASTGYWVYDHFRNLYPTDLRVLTVRGRKTGLRVKISGVPMSPTERSITRRDCDLRGPKGFVWVHERRFSTWYGRSDFEGAFAPWLEKCQPDGAIDIRRMWYYRFVMDAGDIYHPPGSTPHPVTNVPVPNQEYALQMLAQYRSGAGFAFPSKRDEAGNLLWTRERPQLNGDGGGLITYAKELDVEISRGAGIPDDVFTQPAGGGNSFAGRTIPFAACVASHSVKAASLVDCIMQDLIRPLCQMNFGYDDFSHENVEIDIGKMLPGAEGGQGGESGGDPPQRGGAPKSPLQFSLADQLVSSLRSMPSATVTVCTGHTPITVPNPFAEPVTAEESEEGI